MLLTDSKLLAAFFVLPGYFDCSNLSRRESLLLKAISAFLPGVTLQSVMSLAILVAPCEDYYEVGSYG